MFGWLGAGPTKAQVAEQLGIVAATVGEGDGDDLAFTSKAKAAADVLGPASIRQLRKCFHKPPPKPAEASDRFNRLGEWMENCQFAIFEILYYLREPALPLLHAVADGPYDWTQPKAINVLCRLAIEGVDAQSTAWLVLRRLKTWSYETSLNARDAIAHLATISPDVMRAFHAWVRDWQDDGDPVDAFELVAALSRRAPAAAREHEAFLRGLMRGKGLENRTALLDEKCTQVKPGVFAAVSGIEYPHLPDFHAIRAAAVLRRLFPDDAEAIARLQTWSQSHPEESIRNQIVTLLQDPDSPA